MKMKELDSIDWEDIIDTIEDGRCMLFIGQSAFQAPGGETITSALSEHLGLTENAEEKSKYIKLHNPDGFYVFNKPSHRRRVVRQIREFHNQDFPETQQLFERIAQIPFNYIFQLTTDNLLARTYDSLGFDYTADFYFKHQKAPEKFEVPHKSKPLLYNILGNIEEPESILLTYNELFDYMNSMFQGNSMNEDLKAALTKVDYYIFLGLSFEKWYFQLLLRMLSLHSNESIESIALKEFSDNHIKQVYKEEFKIEFIPTKGEAFIHKLYEVCKEDGLLKPLPRKDARLAQMGEVSAAQIQTLVAEAKLADALLHLEAFLNQKKPQSSELFTPLFMLRSRQKRLRQREINNTIYPQNLEIEINLLVEQILELIQKADAL